jgi:hypothetical protein
MSGSTSNNVIGSGSDSITLKMAEDQALGTDAQFTVNVDGQQIGGVQTVTASQASGQTEDFTFNGDYGTGQHTVTVSFVNNFIYPGLSGDRNLYVDGVSYDGQTVSNSTTPVYQSPVYPPNSTTGNIWGNAQFQVNDTTAIPSGASPQTTTPGAVSVGSGSDTLVLNMAEDYYQGDAQFTVSVDGKQIGGTQTTTAIVGEGQSQEFDVHGDFGSGTHTVTVDFLNDQIDGFYPGTTWAVDTTDRNLYVMGASLNGGSPTSGAPWELSSSGAYSFNVTSGNNSSATEFNSGLFASNGSAASDGLAAVTSGSLATPTTMSFTTGSTSSSGTASSSGNSSSSTGSSSSGGSSGSSGDTTVSSAVSGTTPTVQDVTSSSSGTATTPSTGSDNTSSSGGSGTWTSYHHHGYHNADHASSSSSSAATSS